jgi:hypothetical protein
VYLLCPRLLIDYPISQGDGFQNTLDGFLNETGYIEGAEARSNIQSGSQKNELDDFLRKMGYIE